MVIEERKMKMENGNAQALEEKVSFAKNLGHLALYTGKVFIPYIGDKAFHKLANKNRGLIDKKKLDLPKGSITGIEALFYISKYAALGSLAYEIGKRFF